MAGKTHRTKNRRVWTHKSYTGLPAVVLRLVRSESEQGEKAVLLKLRRSQRQGGLTGGKVFFALDARVEVSPEERMLIDKYRLGDLSVYDSEARKQQSQAAAGSFYDAQGSGSWLSIAKGATRLAMAAFTLRVTINGLVNGQHIECKSLDELLGAEEAIREACDNLKNYLATALTFDGRELVLEF